MPAESETLRVGTIQLNSGEDLRENLERCQRLIGEAAACGARFVALPENFAFFGGESQKRCHAESLGTEKGPILSMLTAAAREHRIYLLAGGWPMLSGDPLRPYNAASVVDPNGNVMATYRKIHLFDVDAPDGRAYRESNGVTAGSEIVCVRIEGFEVGLSICYDVRFPELYRKLVDEGAEILCVPAAFTKATGQAHWHLLCRTRAVESQCYVVAPGQCGTHGGGRETFGHSLIVDPWGEIMEDAGESVGVRVATLNRSRLEEIRRKLPSLRHRRL